MIENGYKTRIYNHLDREKYLRDRGVRIISGTIIFISFVLSSFEYTMIFINRARENKIIFVILFLIFIISCIVYSLHRDKYNKALKIWNTTMDSDIDYNIKFYNPAYNCFPFNKFYIDRVVINYKRRDSNWKHSYVLYYRFGDRCTIEKDYSNAIELTNERIKIFP